MSPRVDFNTPMAMLDRHVAGQLIVVTGGASGIGEACCWRLALLGLAILVPSFIRAVLLFLVLLLTLEPVNIKSPCGSM